MSRKGQTPDGQMLLTENVLKHGRRGKNDNYPGCTDEFVKSVRKRRKAAKAARKARKKSRK